jgi:hypothetical protein
MSTRLQRGVKFEAQFFYTEKESTMMSTPKRSTRKAMKASIAQTKQSKSTSGQPAQKAAPAQKAKSVLNGTHMCWTNAEKAALCVAIKSLVDAGTCAAEIRTLRPKLAAMGYDKLNAAEA